MSWMIMLSDFQADLCVVSPDKRIAHRRKLLEHPNLRLKSIRCRTGLELLHQLLAGALSQEDLI